MSRIVIAGIDTICGANVAAGLSGRHDVLGLSLSEPLSIEGCETVVCLPRDRSGILRTLAAARPQWTIYCGPAAESCWEGGHLVPAGNVAAEMAGTWAKAAAAAGSAFTMISSDGVFTGPWMFHRENAEANCQCPAAMAILEAEAAALATCPEALIIRTHVFGWAPFADRPGLVERIVRSEPGQSLELDSIRHATPILATDLADILDQAYAEQLHGVYHIGGAERVNPYRFAALLASRFDRPLGTPVADASLADRRKEFGCGETSLQGRRIRNALEISLPLLGESLDRLHLQSLQGFPERFSPTSKTVREMVA